jgi:hypothetical protein
MAEGHMTRPWGWLGHPQGPNPFFFFFFFTLALRGGSGVVWPPPDRATPSQSHPLGQNRVASHPYVGQRGWPIIYLFIYIYIYI